RSPSVWPRAGATKAKVATAEIKARGGISMGNSFPRLTLMFPLHAETKIGPVALIVVHVRGRAGVVLRGTIQQVRGSEGQLGVPAEFVGRADFSVPCA